MPTPRASVADVSARAAWAAAGSAITTAPSATATIAAIAMDLGLATFGLVVIAFSFCVSR